MDKIIVTLEKGVDVGYMRALIENMKGVLRATVRKDMDEGQEEIEKWIKKMRELGSSIDSSIVDMSDPKTKYIMSK